MFLKVCNCLRMFSRFYDRSIAFFLRRFFLLANWNQVFKEIKILVKCRWQTTKTIKNICLIFWLLFLFFFFHWKKNYKKKKNSIDNPAKCFHKKLRFKDFFFFVWKFCNLNPNYFAFDYKEELNSSTDTIWIILIDYLGKRKTCAHFDTLELTEDTKIANNNSSNDPDIDHKAKHHSAEYKFKGEPRPKEIAFLEVQIEENVDHVLRCCFRRSNW